MEMDRSQLWSFRLVSKRMSHRPAFTETGLSSCCLARQSVLSEISQPIIRTWFGFRLETNMNKRNVYSRP